MQTRRPRIYPCSHARYYWHSLYNDARLGQRLPSFFLPYNACTACLRCPAAFRCLVIDVAQNHSLISHSLEEQWPPPCASLVGNFSPAFHRMTILLVLGSYIALESTPLGEHAGKFQSSPQLGLHRRHQPAHHPDISSHLLSLLGIEVLPIFLQDRLEGLWTFPLRQALYRPCPRLQSGTCIRGSLSPKTRSFSTTV
jgi:hypothetical protein